jgi:hypothetical protein
VGLLLFVFILVAIGVRGWQTVFFNTMPWGLGGVVLALIAAAASRSRLLSQIVIVLCIPILVLGTVLLAYGYFLAADFSLWAK